MRIQNSHPSKSGSSTPLDKELCGCTSPLYKMVPHVQITCAHPPVYFKSFLEDLQYLIQCKCYGNSCLTILFREYIQEKWKKAALAEHRLNFFLEYSGTVADWIRRGATRGCGRRTWAAMRVRAGAARAQPYLRSSSCPAPARSPAHRHTGSCPGCSDTAAHSRLGQLWRTRLPLQKRQSYRMTTMLCFHRPCLKTGFYLALRTTKTTTHLSNTRRGNTAFAGWLARIQVPQPRN